MNNENPANTQNSTIHQENNVYRYIKEKKLVTNTYAFENIMHGHLFGMNCIQFFFFCEPCFFDLSTQHIPFLFYLVTNCLSILVAEGGWTGSPTIALDFEAKESVTSFMNSNLDFGFLTVNLIKYKSSEATVTKG